MRTTIVLDEDLGKRLKGLAPRRGLSEFVNRCLWEHFEREEKARRLARLEASYARAARGKKPSEFDVTDREAWPEW